MLSLCGASDHGWFGVLQSRLKLIGNLPKDVQAPLSKMHLALSGQVSTELTLPVFLPLCISSVAWTSFFLYSHLCVPAVFHRTLSQYFYLCVSAVLHRPLSSCILTSVYQPSCTEFSPCTDSSVSFRVLLPLCISSVAHSFLSLYSYHQQCCTELSVSLYCQPCCTELSLPVLSALCISRVAQNSLTLCCQQCLHKTVNPVCQQCHK